MNEFNCIYEFCLLFTLILACLKPCFCVTQIPIYTRPVSHFTAELYAITHDLPSKSFLFFPKVFLKGS